MTVRTMLDRPGNPNPKSEGRPKPEVKNSAETNAARCGAAFNKQKWLANSEGEGQGVFDQPVNLSVRTEVICHGLGKPTSDVETAQVPEATRP